MDNQQELVEEPTDVEEKHAAVEESEELNDIVQRVVQTLGDEASKVLQRWRAILSKYQEESQLLDPLLEGIVSPLAQLLHVGLHAAHQAQAQSRIFGVCRLLNVLVSVRGYKTIVRFMPHDAADLEAVLSVLLVIKSLPPPAKGGDEELGLARWEAQSILLLWLSMLILIPFGLATVDTSETLESQQGARKPYTLLVGRVLELCQDYLHHPGTVRDMAALLLGRLLTRPDMGPALHEWLAWSQQQLSAATTAQGADAPFLVAGVLQTLSVMFKLGQRGALLPYAPAVWVQVSTLHAHQSTCAPGAGGAAGVLARKLSIKLTQRVALTFMAPRLAPWRYQRTDAGQDLELRLGAGGGGREEAGSQAEGAEEHEEEDFELAEEVEQVIEVLLTSLRDKDTVVRWSAAKGVGRITGCLPRELGDEVVQSVTTLFKQTEGDTAWHGGCLALAELARRGLLLPERLAALTPAIQQALLYDVRRGPHSIGAHVRDAAAYVCWAFARAYAPEAMAPCVHVLATTLMTMACYDREVNCRRAAAAAFQECVGRLGDFPHGIELMGVADYFAVGNLNNAYLQVAVSVVQFPPYQLPLAQHLVLVQLRHWDKALRELAAKAIAALVPAVGAGYLAHQGLDTLLPLCTDQALETRHGAVVGVAELLPALQAAGLTISPQHTEQIAGLVPAIDKARLYRGKGGEVMREAVSKLIWAMGRVNLPLNTQQHAKVLEALDENLRSPQAHIQRAAVVALRQYARVYVQSSAWCAQFTRFYDGFVARLHDPNVAVRRGYALALGALPLALLQERAGEVVEALIGGTVIEEEVDERDTEARVNCVLALTRACDTLYGRAQAGEGDAGDTPAAAGPPVEGVKVMLEKVIPCFHTCLCDYTLDNRGDVGSWVREVAMLGLTRAMEVLAQQLQTYPPSQGDPAGILDAVVPGVVAALLKQAVERIARMREAAMQHLRALTTPSTSQVASHVPAASSLLQALPTDDGALQGITSLEALGRLAGLMACAPAYRSALLEGLVSSVGGLDAQLAKAASAALLAQLTEEDDGKTRAPVAAGGQPFSSGPSGGAGPANGSNARDGSFLSHVGQDLIGIWRHHAKSARMAGPLLRTAALLVTRCPELCTLPMQPTQPVHTIQQPATDTTQSTTQQPVNDPSHATASQLTVQPASNPTQQPVSGSSHQLVNASTQQPVGGSSSSPKGRGQGTMWCSVVVELARSETRACPDVPRLLDAATLLCHLVACPNPCRTSAYQGLMVLLANKYPKVRRHTAEQLYLALLPMGPEEVGASDSGCSAESAEAAVELLLTTAWDAGLPVAKESRDALAGHLGVTVPAMKAGAGGGDKAAAGKDEHSSYQSLLDDFARGV